MLHAKSTAFKLQNVSSFKLSIALFDTQKILKQANVFVHSIDDTQQVLKNDATFDPPSNIPNLASHVSVITESLE